MSGASDGAEEEAACLNTSPDQKIVLSVIGSLLALVSAVGNGVVVWTVYKTPSLHSVTYRLLASLAGADFLVGAIALPLSIAQATVVCNVLDYSIALNGAVGFFYVHTLACALFNLCAVSVDRYISVKYALRYNAIATRTRCSCALVIIWASSILLGSLRFAVASDDAAEYYELVIILVVFVLPFVLITFCYFHIFRESRRQSRLIAAAEQRIVRRTSRLDNSRASVTFAIVVGGLFLCVLPLFVFSLAWLILEFRGLEDAAEDELEKWYSWVLLSTHLNSVINPWIYCVRKKEFRDSFKRTLFCWKC